MHQSHIGLFPASTVSIEACACRIPFVTGCFVKNQQQLYSSLIELKLAVGIGEIDHNLRRINEEIANLYCNKALQEALVSNQIKALDKKAKFRFLDIFHGLSHSK